MYQEKVVLCGASAYEQKYYFNSDFQSLPEYVKQELQILCVLYTEEIGGVLTLEFDENGELQFVGEFYSLAGADSYMHRFNAQGEWLEMYCCEHN